MARFRSYLFIFPVVLLAGCGTAKRRQAVVQPLVTAPAAQPEPQAASAPTPPAPPPAEAVPTQPDAVSVLVTHAEVLYAAGMKEYRAGNMEIARRDFDKALAILLESNFDVNGDERLSAEFDKLVENIHAVEVATLERGDTLSDQKSEPTPIESLTGLTFPVDPNVKQRVQQEIQSVHSDLPLVSNDLVDGVLTYFQNRGSGFINKVLARVGAYQPLISETLRKEGVPQELIYLAASESGFNPLARSRKGAMGIWQFMLGTGMLYGLRRDRWVDERKDPVKATQAAARHLKDLYQQFGDWYLAMAAYDSGPVTVQKAIEKTGYADFWELRKLHALPRETENYVPIFLATALIAKDPKAYGFDIQPDPPLATDPVVVSVPTDLRLIAQLTNHDVEELIKLNPSLLSWTTPAYDPEFVLYLPPGTADAYNQGIASIPEDKRIWWRVHTVADGESLSAVASKYHLSRSALIEANQIEPDDPVALGTLLVLPLPAGRESLLARVHTRGPRQLYRYRVQRGDTLELIADRFDVTPYQIRRWNNLSSSRIVVGKTLRVYVTGERSSRSRSRRKTSRATPANGGTSAQARAKKQPSSSGSAFATPAAR